MTDETPTPYELRRAERRDLKSKVFHVMYGFNVPEEERQAAVTAIQEFDAETRRLFPDEAPKPVDGISGGAPFSEALSRMVNALPSGAVKHDFESNDAPDAARRGKPTCRVCGMVESNIEALHA